MPLATGTPVGEYEVVRQLGAGAMGEVYEAVHPMIGKRVAIKVMRTPASEALVEARRLLEEARVVNAIRHPAIIDIFGANVLPDGRPFLVMELLEGQSLQEYLKANYPLTIADVVSLLERTSRTKLKTGRASRGRWGPAGCGEGFSGLRTGRPKAELPVLGAPWTDECLTDERGGPA